MHLVVTLIIQKEFKNYFLKDIGKMRPPTNDSIAPYLGAMHVTS